MKPVPRNIVCLIILLVSVCQGEILHAQKIYLLMAADIHDNKIGASTRQDLWSIYNVFVRQVAVTQLVICHSSNSGVPVWRKPQIDSDTWREPGLTFKENLYQAIDKAIRSCPANSNDTIVFYWSGHGSYDERGHYLIMPNHHPLQRSKVIKQLKEKTCRLVVLLTDCCHEYLDRELLPKMEPRALPPPPQTSVLFRALFLRPRGLVDINASSQGEYALCVPSGGLFTLALASMVPKDYMLSSTAYRGIDVEPNNENRLRSPYGLIIEDDRGGTSTPPQVDQGLLPAYGVLYRYAGNNVTWSFLVEKARFQVKQAFLQLYPSGFYDNNRKKLYTTQTVDYHSHLEINP